MEKLNISARIVAYRRRHSLTQAAFGELLGVTPQAVSKWERDVCCPDVMLLPRLATLLSCTVSDFFLDAVEE